MERIPAPWAVFDISDGDGRKLEISEAGLTIRCEGSEWMTPWELVWTEETEDDFTLQLEGQGLIMNKDDLTWEQMEELRRLLLRFSADRYHSPYGRMPR